MYKDKKLIGMIPARLASSRLQGKLLKKIGEHSIIKRVYFQCKKSKFLDHVAVITDHEDIYNHVKSFGADVQMSHSNHLSGTDRIGEAAFHYDAYDYVINIQGDEPFISPVAIDNLVKELIDQNAAIGTPVCKFENKEEVANPNLVKVVRSKEKYALYFSRAVIPFQRDLQPDSEYCNYWRHIGMYAFQRSVLLELTKLQVSEIEQCEMLEQLRWLDNGFRILTVEQDHPIPGIDTEEDLVRAIQFATIHNL